MSVFNIKLGVLAQEVLALSKPSARVGLVLAVAARRA